MNDSALHEFAVRYTAAWCSRQAASVVAMDSLVQNGAHPVYHWTLTGTNTGPGGTGKAVRIHGFEEWTIGADGLIAASLGHYDEAEYARQLNEGVATRRR